MGSSLITIAADIPDLDKVIAKLDRMQSGGGLPYTKEAVRTATTDLIQQTWIQFASGATVTYSGGTFRISVVSGQYLQSIQDGVRFPEDLTGEVFSNCPYADLIENGQAPRDMKEGLLNSPKAKMSKSGNRYITIPFRHGTPGSTGLRPMPKRIYDQAKQLGYSRRNGLLQKAWGLLTTGKWKKYTWGGRLGNDQTGRTSHISPHPGAGYTQKTGHYAGMVKMGQPGHTQYLTFRRVSDNSDPRSWQHPGVKPKPIREAVVEHTRTEAVHLIRNGFDMDLYFTLGGGG